MEVFGQTAPTTNILDPTGVSPFRLGRVIYFRQGSGAYGVRAPSTQANNELAARKSANQSMRNARKALSRKKLIKKEKS